MNLEIFEEVKAIHEASKGERVWTNDLAIRYGYPSSEAMRSAYRRAKKIYGTTQVAPKRPRVGVVDIETLPMEVYSFGLYDQNIGIEQIISDMCVLSWAGKFLNEPDIYSDILTPKEAPQKDDRRIVQSCHGFIDQCDVVIGHNWVAFDGKILNTQFLLYGLSPVQYTAVDTLTTARSNFRFSSNKLRFLNEKLGIRNKLDNSGFPLWRKCHQGDKDSLKLMLEYNIGDILATESLFYRLRPFIKGFNVSLYNEIEGYQCPACGSSDLVVKGYKYTTGGKYESVRCSSCGCISRKKQNLISKEKRKNILVK